MNTLLILLFNVFLIYQVSDAGIISKNNVRAPGDPVPVTIYYENLNVANRKFFIDEFRPVYDNLWDIIDLELVPYGNTSYDSSTNFTCPYGDNQCFANRIQACAIGNLLSSPTPDPAVKKSVALYTYCIFKNREFTDIHDLAAHCATEDLNDDWPTLEICERTDQGNTIYDQMRQKTEPVAAQLVNGLAVSIDGTVNPDAVNNLVKVVCDTYEPAAGQSKPDRCNNTDKAPKVKVGIYYETLDLTTRNFITQQIGPFYHVIEDIVEIDLIPYGNTQYDNSNGNNTFNCSSGRTQCFANRLQAIVVDEFLLNPPNGDEIDGPSRAINFISCMFGSNEWQQVYKAGEVCSNLKLPFDDWIHLLILAQSPESDPIFLNMKTKTDAVANGSPLPAIPFTTINGEPSVATRNDWIQEVCARYTGIKPSICTKIDIVVYYEALNHKSRKFIMEELKPTFTYFQNLINLRLLPAGRATRNPDGPGFVCPGGPDQCHANILQACTLDYFWNDGSNWTDPIRQEVMEFLYCMSKNKNAVGADQAAEQCAEQYIEVDPWFTIHGCAIGSEGSAIFEEYIEETQSAGLNISSHTIPVVTIHGIENASAVDDLIGDICHHFDDSHKPDRCFVGKAPKLEIGVYYESLSELSRRFFKFQMGPWFKYIEEMVQIDLLPNGNVVDSNGTNTNDGKCATKQSDCMANKIQAVVIDDYWLHDDDGDQIDGTIRTTQFLTCVFNHPNWTNDIYTAGQRCSQDYLPNDEWNDILLTAESELGDQIYSTVQNKTKELKDRLGLGELPLVPYVTLNGHHSLKTANDLLQTVCSQYTGDKPLECTPVVVEIYYETLNPQSRKFYLEELRPTFEHIRESVTIDLIPFGRTQMNIIGPNETTFDCPNGEQQCLGNKIQACAISKFLNPTEDENNDQFDSKNQTIMFIWCMYKNVDNEQITNVAEKCGNQWFLDDIFISDILLCAKSDEGDQIMRQMGARTLNLAQPLEHSPWVVINGQRSALAQTNLQQIVCNNILGDQPVECQTGKAAKVNVELHYVTGGTADLKYVTEELYPSYRDIEEIMELEIVPFGLSDAIKGDDGNYSFSCTNGPNECIGNRIHACVYSYYWHNDDDPISDNMDINGRLQTLDFINCYYKNSYWPSDPYRAAEQCINNIWIDMWPRIDQCVQSPEGMALYAQLQDRVNALFPPLTYTPWITINGKHSRASELHLTRAVCDAYTGTEKPWACYAPVETPQKPIVDIHYEPLNSQSKSFVLAQLDHLVTHVDEIVNLNIFPYGRTIRSDTTRVSFQCPDPNGVDTDCHTFKHHACVMDRYLQNYTVETLNFLVCAFGSDWLNVPQVTEKCLNDYFVDPWPTIDTCAHTDGDRLLNNIADQLENLNPKLSHVPWILVNGEHNLEAEDNLIQEICDSYYPDDKPPQCVPELLPVSVNYENMDQTVAEFFIQQLGPYFQYLDDVAIFEYDPYGTTKRQPDGSFQCTQGDIQCNANKVHACVIDSFYTRENHTLPIDIDESRLKTIQFFVCVSSKNLSDPINDAEQCVNQVFEGDYWRVIDACAHGPDGTQLYTQLAIKTEALSPPLDHVPWVTINNTHNHDAETNLLRTVCNAYSPLRPSVCTILPKDTVNVGLFYSSNQASSAWVVNQLKQFYTDSTPSRAVSLQQIISTSFIPWGNTIYNGNGTDQPFTCPNGESECTSNRIHACAMDKHLTEPKGPLHVTEFIICFFDNSEWQTNPSNVGNECANKVWVLDPWPEIDICATQNTDENIAIYLNMRDKTLTAGSTYYPWVTVNDQHNVQAETDLLSTVCDQYPGTKPDACSPTSPTSPPTGTTPTTVSSQTPEISTTTGSTTPGISPSVSTASPSITPSITPTTIPIISTTSSSGSTGPATPSEATASPGSTGPTAPSEATTSSGSTGPTAPSEATTSSSGSTAGPTTGSPQTTTESGAALNLISSYCLLLLSIFLFA